MKRIMISCLVLAIFAAVVYFLMATGTITVPTLSSEDKPAAIVYAAAGCYALGGFLIMAKKRGLWIFGLVMNTLVITFFFMMYNQKPDVMLSLAGLATKIPQVLLEVGLVSLIVNYKKIGPNGKTVS